jgi:Leucine-rich repeat (LRR) protein
MKNTFTLQFLCFVFFVSVLSVHAQDIVHIPDANFKAALVGNQNINTNGDGEIQISEAEYYTGELYVSNKWIYDLSGIEAFISLIFLNCSGNNLSNLDVSSNMNLWDLDCSGNNLSRLDVGSNTNLTYLDCSSNNLSSLDVSQNINLWNLNCSRNNLSSLNIQNGSNLNLYTHNFANNPSLTCIQVDDAAYANANFTHKDAIAEYSTDCNLITDVGIVHIPDANFKAALLYEHTIDTNGDGEIQVSEAESYTGGLYVSNKGIYDLSGIEAFISLISLDCSVNKLSSLDVSQNINLGSLNCGGNKFSSLDMRNNTALVYLSCGSGNLSSLDVSNNTALEILNCSLNNLSSLDVSNNTALTYLDCKNNNLSSLDVSKNAALTALVCQNNNLLSLNIQNGNNNNWFFFSSINNPNLTCIQVDDAAYANANFTNKDAWAEYGTNCAITTSTKNALARITNIYPNPASSVLTIETTEEILSKEVIGLDGLLKLADNNNTNTLDISTIPSGVYFISIKTQGGVYQDKFVKK